MARFSIEGPDGAKYVIEGPDDASEADILKFAEQQFASAEIPRAPATDTRGKAEGKFAAPGLAASVPPKWSEVPWRALENAPQSAKNFAVGLVQPILHPIETATTLKELAVGLASKVGGAAGVGGDDAKAKAEREKTVDTVWRFLKDRYGSVDAVKKTLANDPVGAMADLSVVLTGGGAAAARAPSAVGSFGRILKKAGDVVDPLQMATRGVSGGRKVVEQAAGLASGTGNTPYSLAYLGGRQGRPVVMDAMLDRRPMTEAVDMAERADKAAAARRTAYQSGTQTLKSSQTPINFQPIMDALKASGDELHVKGIIKDPKAAEVHTAIADKVADFMTLPPVERTPIVADALKQSIGAIQQRIPHGDPARNPANAMYHAVKNEIAAQVPEYSNAMKGYADASDALKELRGTFSINDKALPDTTLRKLQSTMRNNVQTNYGQRTKLLDDLAKYEPDLPFMLAGQTLNAWAPRGLARMNALPTGLSMLANPGTIPATAGLLPLMSPRAMGAFMYGSGRAVRAGEDALSAFKMTPVGIDRAILMEHALNQATKAPRDENMGLTGTIRPKGAYTYGWEE